MPEEESVERGGCTGGVLVGGKGEGQMVGGRGRMWVGGSVGSGRSLGPVSCLTSGYVDPSTDL